MKLSGYTNLLPYLPAFLIQKFYAYFGLNSAVKQFGNFKGDKAHMSKRGLRLARRGLHIVYLIKVIFYIIGKSLLKWSYGN